MSLSNAPKVEKRKKLLAGSAALVFVALVALGAMAKNGWLPSTDSLTGKKTGWFGRSGDTLVPTNAASAFGRGLGGGTADEDRSVLAPFSPPSPTPQLSKEYIYAGSRLLAVEDANANAAPPADLAIWRPSTGTWWVLGGQGSQQVTQAWGVSGDIPVPGDYDGDGKTDFSVFRPSTNIWYIVNSSTGGTGQFTFGSSGDVPAQADYDGDGKTDAAVFRANDPSSGQGTWYILRSSDSGYYGVPFGLSTDIPAPADYDGDGKADVGVWRSSNQTFYSINSSNGFLKTPSLGTAAASATAVVSSDYDGDGRSDYAVYNSSSASWIIRSSVSGYDAESHQKEFFSASNQTTTPDATYLYDGEGKRVKKTVGTEVTIFVYDASGQLAAEYSTTVVPVAQAAVSYLTTDHLGSPRIITDQNGAVTSRKDFAAFGDETLTVQRTQGLGYQPDNIRQDYTGYQKDDESGLGIRTGEILQLSAWPIHKRRSANCKCEHQKSAVAKPLWLCFEQSV